MTFENFGGEHFYWITVKGLSNGYNMGYGVFFHVSVGHMFLK